MFEFDIVTIIAALVLFLAFAAPFYFNSKKNKKIRAVQIKTFQQHAFEIGLNISNQESWRDRYFLALDDVKRRLLYFHFQEEPTIVDIDLSKVKSIELHEKSHDVGSGKDKRKIIDYLELTFYFKNQESNISLEFYDGEKFSDMEGELPLTKNWQALLKSQLTASTKELVH